MNGVKLDVAIRIEDNGKNSVKGSSCLDKLKIICQKSTLLHLFFCGITFFTAGFVYYGISLNIEKFGGNIFVNGTWNGVAEVIADALAFVLARKIGIRKTLIISFIIMSVGVLTELFCGESNELLSSL